MEYIDSDTRAIFRKVIPSEVVKTVSAVAFSTITPRSKPGIPLNDLVTVEDLRPEWARDPAQRLLATLHVLLRRTSTGRPERAVRSAVRLAGTATAAAELLDFLKYFDSELVDLLISAYETGLIAATTLLTALTSDDDGVAASAATDLSIIEVALDQDARLLASFPYVNAAGVGIGGPWGEEHFEHLFGLPPHAIAPGYRDWANRLEQAGIDPMPVVERQFPYLMPLAEPLFEDPYTGFAFRIALSTFPLLAHRLLFLTSRLLDQAAGTDINVANQYVIGFFEREASWIIAAGPKYEEAMSAYEECRDRPAVVDAYRRLAEGVLRPFGSLMCAMSELVSGDPPHDFVVEPTLGALEQRLRRQSGEPVCHLLVSFIRRDLRNADAHAGAAVGGSGDLLVRLDNGEHEVVNANHVWGTTQTLRSALDGIDSAVNIYFATTAALSVTPESRPHSVLTEEVVLDLARRLAHRHTDGTILSLRTESRSLTAVYNGSADEGALNLVTGQLAYMCGDAFDHLWLVREDGTPVYVLARDRPHEGA